MATTRHYPIQICDDCINLKGKSCNRPECVFCRCSMEEVGEYLDALLIRPVVDGKRFDTDYAFSLADEPRPCKSCGAESGESHTFECPEAQD